MFVYYYLIFFLFLKEYKNIPIYIQVISLTLHLEKCCKGGKIGD